MATKKLTINEFFWFSRSYEDNSPLSGNAHKSKGWISTLDHRHNLVIQTMPHQTFFGFIKDHHTGQVIKMEGSGISKIIQSTNKWMGNK